MFSLHREGKKDDVKVEGTVREEKGDPKMGDEEVKEGNSKVDIIKVCYIHVWNCHSEIHYFVQLTCCISTIKFKRN